MARHLGVHPDAVMVENRWFRLGGQTMLEVFHYSSPDQELRVPRNSDVGGHHVALYVDDLDAAVDHLHAAGVEVLDGPTASRGQAEGNRWIYFLSPWGMQFELVSYPGGKRFDREDHRP
jgi:catechol 2,3-dioxygenase-like lactoylglutathione lyase family enzyme